MKTMVILFDSKYKSKVCAALTANRIQYSTFTDVYTGDVRVSVPYAIGIRLLAELRRSSIPYDLI